MTTLPAAHPITRLRLRLRRRHPVPSPPLTLATVLLGFLALPMLMSGTTVALPRIGADLAASGTSLQWVLSGYFLAVASFGLVAGSLGDLFGRRRVYVAGLLLYIAGLGASAAAPGILALDVARLLSGVGGGAVMTTGGAILAATFTARARTRAFAAMGTISGVGMALGPTLSGFLVAWLDWRLTFVLFAVVGVVMVGGTFFMPRTPAGARPRVDWAGAAILVAGLALLMFGVTQGARTSWRDGVTPVVGAVGVVLLGVFAFVERRRANPVLDLGLVRDRRFLGWLLSAVTLTVGYAGLLVSLPTYLQGAGQASPQRAGALMLMLTVPAMVVPSGAAWLVNRGVPARFLIGGALAALAAGNAWLTNLSPSIGVSGLLGPLALVGVAAGTAVAITDAQAMGLVAKERVGMAAGLLGTIRGGGNALVMAAFGAALIAFTASRVGSSELAGRVAAGDLSGGDRAYLAAGYTSAWHTVLWVTASLSAIGFVVVSLLLREKRVRGQ